MGGYAAYVWPAFAAAAIAMLAMLFATLRAHKRALAQLQTMTSDEA